MKFTSYTPLHSGRFIATKAAALRKILAWCLQASVLALLLAGCAGLPANKSLNLAAASYTVSGKLIIIQPEQRSSARFRWSQQAENFQMALWGPLGVGRTLIAGSPAYAELTQGAEVIDQGAPGAIMQQQLGWSAPIEVFPYWVKGTFAPSVAVATVEKDELGRLVRFSQAGWSVSYADHVQDEGGWRPGRITIAGRDLQLRLILAPKSAK
ncbi:lipoprotein insertase outer membrane protein LolB [Pseudomonadales bacterium]|nr:lipoprotein insertase outer membrane protein LolB [Pseudomonadales bacterium]